MFRLWLDALAITATAAAAFVMTATGSAALLDRVAGRSLAAHDR